MEDDEIEYGFWGAFLDGFLRGAAVHGSRISRYRFWSNLDGMNYDFTRIGDDIYQAMQNIESEQEEKR